MERDGLVADHVERTGELPAVWALNFPDSCLSDNGSPLWKVEAGLAIAVEEALAT